MIMQGKPRTQQVRGDGEMAAKRPQEEQSPAEASLANDVKTDALDPGELLRALTSFKKGDFSVRMKEGTGTAGKIASALNDVIELNQEVTDEFER